MSIRSRKCMQKLIDKDWFVVGCSSGVILCCSVSCCNSSTRTTYYVCNPMTDELHLLPECNNKLGVLVTGFLYEDYPDKDGYTKPCYTVVRVFPRNFFDRNVNGLLPIESYSSESGIWKESILKGAEEFVIIPTQWCPCEAFKGKFCWMGMRFGEGLANIQDYILIYGPRCCSDDNRIWTIRACERLITSGTSKGSIFTESAEGILHYAVDDTRGFGITRLRLPLRNYSTHTAVPSSEWIRLLNVDYCFPRWGDFWDPCIIAFHPENLRFILMRYGSLVFRYDIELGVSQSIWCLPPTIS